MKKVGALRSRASVSMYLGRGLLAVISVLIVAGTIFMTLRYRVEPTPFITAMVLDDATKEAMGLKREQSETLYQMAILSIGATLGLFIAKKDEARLVLKDTPEIIMAAIGLTLLLASLWFYISYLGAIEEIYFSARRGGATGDSGPLIIVANLRDPKIDYLLVFQQRLFVAGGFVTLLTLMSAHMLKGDTAQGDNHEE